MKSSKPTKMPARGPRKGYADGGYVPAKGTKSVKELGLPGKPMKSGKLF